MTSALKDAEAISFFACKQRAAKGSLLSFVASATNRRSRLMCFVPACFEIVGMLLLAPRLLGISLIDAAIIGAVVAAVSPAVIVPKMLKLMKEGYGTDKSIPQLILAGASVDDVFVIVMFTAFTGLAQGGTVSAASFVQIPVSIIVGVLVGGIVGFILAEYFKTVHVRDTFKVVLILCLSFILVISHAVRKTDGTAEY